MHYESANHAVYAWECGSFKLANLGKTLNLSVSQLCTFIGRSICMFTVFAQIVRFFAPTPAKQDTAGPAGQLMDSADACAGTNPRQAQELREAAYAYLSVVR